MIGRYTMGAGRRLPRLEEGEMRGPARLPAGDDFEDLEFLAVLHELGDRNGRPAADNDDAVGPYALGAQDLFDGGMLVRKFDAGGRFVKPAADSNFGRNPSITLARKRLSRELCFKASPGSQARFLPR